MSIVSTILIFVVQVVVGDIVVGRVRVEDMVYDIEPLSNCNHISSQAFSWHIYSKERGDKHPTNLANLPPSSQREQTSTQIQIHKPQVATAGHPPDSHTAQFVPDIVSCRHLFRHRIGRPILSVSFLIPSQTIDLDQRGQPG